MQILTLDNVTFSMNDLPEEVDDMRFAVLDNSNPKEPDYFFIPLIFLQSFNSPALVLKIGKHTVRMPRDWMMLIGEPDHGDLEVIPLTSLNDRGFHAFLYNPRSDFRPEFAPVEIVDVYQDVKWYFPKLKPGQLLAVPLHGGEKPKCAYFVEEISRTSEIVDVQKVW
jgi:hypothetical protein